MLTFDDDHSADMCNNTDKQLCIMDIYIVATEAFHSSSSKFRRRTVCTLYASVFCSNLCNVLFLFYLAHSVMDYITDNVFRSYFSS